MRDGRSSIWHDVHDGQLLRGADAAEAIEVADTVQNATIASVRGELVDRVLARIQRIGIVVGGVAAVFGIVYAIASCGGPTRHHYAGLTMHQAMTRADEDLETWSGRGDHWLGGVYLLGVKRITLGGVEFLHMRFWDADKKRHICINESEPEWYARVCS